MPAPTSTNATTLFHDTVLTPALHAVTSLWRVSGMSEAANGGKATE